MSLGSNARGHLKKKFMHSLKKIILFSICLLVSTAALAQEKEKLKVEISGDFVTSYLWRGQELAASSIQPSLWLSYGGLGVELWASYELEGKEKYREIDLTVAYRKGGFLFFIRDIFGGKKDLLKDTYFKYGNNTDHTFEATIGYDFGPARLSWNTTFAGCDGVNNSGHRAYSSYAEVEVPFRLSGFNFMGSVGIVPYASTLLKAKGFAVTNLQLIVKKDLKITDSFRLPVFFGTAANPATSNLYVAFGFSLQP